MAGNPRVVGFSDATSRLNRSLEALYETLSTSLRVDPSESDAVRQQVCGIEQRLFEFDAACDETLELCAIARRKIQLRRENADATNDDVEMFHVPELDGVPVHPAEPVVSARAGAPVPIGAPTGAPAGAGGVGVAGVRSDLDDVTIFREQITALFRPELMSSGRQQLPVRPPPTQIPLRSSDSAAQPQAAAGVAAVAAAPVHIGRSPLLGVQQAVVSGVVSESVQVPLMSGRGIGVPAVSAQQLRKGGFAGYVGTEAGTQPGRGVGPGLAGAAVPAPREHGQSLPEMIMGLPGDQQHVILQKLAGQRPLQDLQHGVPALSVLHSSAPAQPDLRAQPVPPSQSVPPPAAARRVVRGRERAAPPPRVEQPDTFAVGSPPQSAGGHRVAIDSDGVEQFFSLPDQ